MTIIQCLKHQLHHNVLYLQSPQVLQQEAHQLQLEQQMLLKLLHQRKMRTKPGNILAGVGFNKSASVLRRRIEEGHSNQAFTSFAPIGMAEDLTKIQYTLCNEIKTELQAVKESVTAIPFTDLKKPSYRRQLPT